MSSPKDHTVRYNLRVPKDKLKQLKEVSLLRRVSLNSLILSAIEYYLDDGKTKENENKLLSSLSINQKNLKVDVEIIAEMLSFFVMHYFCYTPEMPESQKKALFISGKNRHNKFMELLKKRLHFNANPSSQLFTKK